MTLDHSGSLDIACQKRIGGACIDGSDGTSWTTPASVFGVRRQRLRLPKKAMAAMVGGSSASISAFQAGNLAFGMPAQGTASEPRPMSGFLVSPLMSAAVSMELFRPGWPSGELVGFAGLAPSGTAGRRPAILRISVLYNALLGAGPQELFMVCSRNCSRFQMRRQS
jgi:hypothetical protein